MKALLKIFFIFLIPLASHANFCQSLQEDIPVLAAGRVKPYFVFAKESIKFLTGKSKFEGEPQQLTTCRIYYGQKQGSTLNIPILVEHVETKKFLDLDEDKNSMNALDLVSKKDLIRSEILRQKETTSYKKDLNKLWARVDLFDKIRNGDAFYIYTGNKSELKKEAPMGWQPLNELNEISINELSNLIQSSKQLYLSNTGDDTFLLELRFVKMHLFGYALALALLAIFLSVLLKSLTWPVVCSVALVGLETIAMTMRVLISGRAPITNMYETVMFSGYGALVIALIILIFKREKLFLLGGLSYNMLCLFMLIFAHGMLDSSISPLVPVLRDNFWLSTHVTTIILSYAALALSWMVANITLFKMRFGTIDAKEYKFHQDLIYTCIKVGVVLLAAGIILGGVWADYSWGRFWGWDPKETWSLIVLLFYMILLHGKYSSWINTHRFVLMSAAGFMTVMMAWFGVNYILAAGLHSYGFSEGGAIFLGSFFLIQTIYIIVCSKNQTKVKASA